LRTCRDWESRNRPARPGRGLGWRAAALAVAVGLLLLAGLMGCGPGRVLARVGSNEVREAEWLSQLLRQRGPEELVAMIDEVLIRQEAAKLGIKPSKEATRAKIEEIVALVGSQAELDRRLEELHMTLDELEQRAETLALLDALVRKQVKISEAEMVEYYNKHRQEFRHGVQARARLMLFSSKDNAEAVLEALKAGGDFAGLAKALSEDPGTKDAGGDTGWIEASDYAPAISKVIFSLKPGQTSGIFKGPDGWYIVKLEKKQPPRQLTFDEVRDRIKQRLLQDKLLAERAKWLIKKRSEAAIVIKDPRLADRVWELLRTAPPPAPLPGLMTPDQLFARGRAFPVSAGSR